MKTFRFILIALLLIFAVVANLSPRLARADKNDDEKPIKLFAVASMSPIGIAHSSGRMLINGRLQIGEEWVWGGELVQAPFDTNMTLQLDDIGQVSLRKGSIARFATTLTTFADGTSGRKLITWLAQGDMKVSLQADAGAYVEAGSSTFHAERGATFKISIRDGMAELADVTGNIEVAPQNVQAARKIFPLGASGRPVAEQGKIQVRLRSTRTVQFQVTDENDRPLPDIPIIITLGSSAHGVLGAGATTISTTTGANGVASANFVGGAVKGTDSVTAQISGSNVQWQGTVVWSPPPLPVWVKFGIPAAAATAGATTAVVVTRNNNNTDNRQGLGNGGVTVRP